MPIDRLLGDGPWSIEPVLNGVVATATLSRDAAADVQARLRGLAFDGLDLTITVRPKLKRNAVRDARSRDARARRSTTPGFTKAKVQLDDEGRWSLTPESLALAMARRAHCDQVLDLTCGAGGNAIGFARAGCSVTAIDLHPGRLDMARHNAQLYGVRDRIIFHSMDATAALDDVDTETLIFFDPPWGDADKRRCTREQIPLLHQLYDRLAAHPRSWLKLPPSFDPHTTPDFDAQPWFGKRAGDRHRVKFLLLTNYSVTTSTAP
ncbi:MAG: putative O-methyltransferase YrrM [Kiritimatiellia bacterium]|jgi:predicted O-methyltransferase YrrM